DRFPAVILHVQWMNFIIIKILQLYCLTAAHSTVIQRPGELKCAQNIVDVHRDIILTFKFLRFSLSCICFHFSILVIKYGFEIFLEIPFSYVLLKSPRKKSLPVEITLIKILYLIDPLKT